jgi:hypothetical protein
MPNRVDFLAAANVVYRRDVLEQLGGFDPRYMKAQDAELAMRVLEAGYDLAFEISSRVDHYYHERWFRYLRTQAQQGYWRVPLHRSHRGRARGDSYSKLMDHAQPPLAILSLVALPLLFAPGGVWITPAPPILLAAAQIPMVSRMVRRTKDVRYVAFGALGFIRAFFRAFGMAAGAAATMRGANRPPA